MLDPIHNHKTDSSGRYIISGVNGKYFDYVRILVLFARFRSIHKGGPLRLCTFGTARFFFSLIVLRTIPEQPLYSEFKQIKQCLYSGN